MHQGLDIDVTISHPTCQRYLDKGSVTHQHRFIDLQEDAKESRLSAVTFYPFLEKSLEHKAFLKVVTDISAHKNNMYYLNIGGSGS